MTDSTKVCAKCKSIKPRSAFSVSSVRASGLRPYCKKCSAIEYKIYIAKNRTKELARRKAFRDNNKEKVKEYSQRFYLANKHKNAAREAKRRCGKRMATPVWADRGYVDFFYKLAKIEESRTGKSVHVDHIVPLQGKNVCGLHVEYNLQLLFANDNFSKGNRF